jgi:hypothetical protein
MAIVLNGFQHNGKKHLVGPPAFRYAEILGSLLSLIDHFSSHGRDVPPLR